MILGLWDGHDAGVALLADGEIVFALSEERPSRLKRYSGFPARSLVACLEYAATRGIAVTDVAVAGRHGRAPLRVLEPVYRRGAPHRDPLGPANRAVRAWENTLPQVPLLRDVERAVGSAVVARRLRRLFAARELPSPRLHSVPHHEAHAFSAMLGEPRERALVFTWDAYGEGTAATARLARRPLEVVLRRGVDIGLAELYGAVTVALGFDEGDEGKVMGLAARGRPSALRRRLSALFHQCSDGCRLRAPLSARRLRTILGDSSREDVAAALQAVAEEQVGGAVTALMRRVGSGRPLLVAGGLFANIRINQVLASLPGVERLFVFPHMTDGGLPAGAAHRVYHALTGALARPLGHVFLGCAFDPGAAIETARGLGLTVRRRSDPARVAARHLQARRVVCRYTGRDEFGPRALGNRSLLFAADVPGLPERVNAALGRDDFMPFGPIVRREEAQALWPARGGGPIHSDLGYMTIAAPATAEFQRASPTAVHLDRTTRPQVVDAGVTPDLHRLLSLYREAGGAPAVINTSFNRHREPIVHSPEDALSTFLASGLDVLLLEEYEILRGAI